MLLIRRPMQTYSDKFLRIFIQIHIHRSCKLQFHKMSDKFSEEWDKLPTATDTKRNAGPQKLIQWSNLMSVDFILIVDIRCKAKSAYSVATAKSQFCLTSSVGRIYWYCNNWGTNKSLWATRLVQSLASPVLCVTVLLKCKLRQCSCIHAEARHICEDISTFPQRTILTISAWICEVVSHATTITSVSRMSTRPILNRLFTRRCNKQKTTVSFDKMD